MKSLERLFKNSVMKKILLFFNENSQSIDTAKGISVWIGCDEAIVQKALDKLVEEEIVMSHKTASMVAYSYTNQMDIVKKIERYIKLMVGKL